MNDTIITLTGWVGTEVDLRDLPGGHRVASFRVGCTSRRLRNNEWVDGTTAWYQVKAWRGLAENVSRSLRVGDPIIVQGRLEADVWTKQDGTVATQMMVTATSVGHDLSKGTSAFVRPRRSEGVPVEAEGQRQGQQPGQQPGQQQGEPTGGSSATDPWAMPAPDAGVDAA